MTLFIQGAVLKRCVLSNVCTVHSSDRKGDFKKKEKKGPEVDMEVDPIFTILVKVGDVATKAPAASWLRSPEANLSTARVYPLLVLQPCSFSVLITESVICHKVSQMSAYYWNKYGSSALHGDYNPPRRYVAGFAGAAAYAYVQNKVRNTVYAKAASLREAAIDRAISEVEANEEASAFDLPPVYAENPPPHFPPTRPPTAAPSSSNTMSKRTYTDAQILGKKITGVTKSIKRVPGLVAWGGNHPRYGSQFAISASKGLHGEVKALDNVQVTYTASTTGAASFILLNGINTGAGFFNRVGAKIALDSLYFHGAFYFNATNTGPVSARVLIYYDRSPNGTAPTLSDLLQSTDAAGTNSTELHSGINLANRERYKIFMDRRYQFPAVTASNGPPGALYGGSGIEFPINEFIRLNRYETVYKSNTVPIASTDVSLGALYMLFLAENTTISMKASSRLRFTDS